MTIEQFLLTVAIVALLGEGFAISSLYDKCEALKKEFKKHGHNTSVDGGTTDEPIEQSGISFEQLMKTIQGVQNKNILDMNALKGLLSSTKETKA